jgi:hypothetical protein
MRKRMAAPTKPKPPIMTGMTIREDRPIPTPTKAWRRRMLRTAWTTPAATPIAIMKIRGSRKPTVLGIPLKNSIGEVRIFTAVGGIVAKSMTLRSMTEITRSCTAGISRTWSP